jgi:hypothetical protein
MDPDSRETRPGLYPLDPAGPARMPPERGPTWPRYRARWASILGVSELRFPRDASPVADGGRHVDPRVRRGAQLSV